MLPEEPLRSIARHTVSTMKPDINESQIYGSLALSLNRSLDVPRVARELKSKLLHRVHASALAHQEYTTVRAEDGTWLAASPGVMRRVLRSDAAVRVEMQRLSPGARLECPDHADGCEVLLLDGALSGMQGSQSSIGLPGAKGYVVVQRGGFEEPLVSVGESTLYVRYLLAARPSIPSLESRWWQLATEATRWLDPGRMRWRVASEGVEVIPLAGDSEVVSMLVRFNAGASVANHGHALDEDCLVLQGEMFLGDILLRTGDYQLAPAGGSHFDENSDVGVLFFFHGAIDPVLRATRAG
jgi:anti-sigma factor ChrR (cupin superfamily)